MTEIKQYSNYLGIHKKENPHWPGWNVIEHYKAKGIKPKDIKDERLEILVENYYLIDYLKFLSEI